MTLFVVVGKNPVNGQEYMTESEDGIVELSHAREIRDQLAQTEDGWEFYVGKVVPVDGAE